MSAPATDFSDLSQGDGAIGARGADCSAWIGAAESICGMVISAGVFQRASRPGVERGGNMPGVTAALTNHVRQ